MTASHIIASNREMNRRVKALAAENARQEQNKVTVRHVEPWSLKEKPEKPIRRRPVGMR